MSAIDFDNIHWEEDASGDIRPRATAVPLNYPVENDVALDVVYGYEDQFVGNLSASGYIPDQPRIRIHNNFDNTATCTIYESDPAATTTLYIFLRHGGVLEAFSAGSRTGDGTITIEQPNGEYIGYAISEISGVKSLPSNHDTFWISGENTTNEIINQAVMAQMGAIVGTGQGIELVFVNGDNALPVTIIGVLREGDEVLQIRDSSPTNTESLVFDVLRQTGFPPSTFRPGGKLIIKEFLREYEIDSIIASQGIAERSASFVITTGNYRWLESVDELP